ncbi:MAG: subtype I-C CRISPR-associated endonuclease Cas1 [Alphaproteobacteria bacterium CG_4_9_14_3_um_filter_47_13]|nr:MAG: subtype I-C CRISPR-associated endonuclease Cas1 [Alphaproteobacteria bacterium CG_4_9_14_3_um_filter_47_13]
MPQIMNTLYVTQEDSYVRLENDTLCVEVDRQKKLQVPLHHIGSVVCFGTAGMSLPAIHRCADDGVSVILLDRNGRFKARVEGSISGNILLRQAHFAKANEPDFCLRIARNMLAGKIRNTRHLMVRGVRDNKDISTEDALKLKETAQYFGHVIRKLPHLDNMDSLRGAEGDAAARWFSVVSNLLRITDKEAFAMNNRTRRPPLDRFNALISFLYALLLNDCRSAVEAAGLDPQLGFLHTVRPGRASLALDLMEEFRSIWADRLALTLINRQQIQASDFVISEGGAVLLKDEARRTVIISYQERKQEEILHPLTAQKMPLGLAPMVQARVLARVIRGEVEDYIPFLVR